MLRGLTVRTKLGALVALAVVAALAAGTIGGWSRLQDRRAADRLGALVQAGHLTGDLLARIETEATTSSWYLASGDPAAQLQLRAARPLTDGAARALWDALPVTADGTTVDAGALRGQWDELRAARAAIDRRTVGDLATLERFARLETATNATLERLADAASGDTAPVLQDRAGLAALETAMAQEQATVATELARGRVSPLLRDQARAARVDQAAAIDATTVSGTPVSRTARDFARLVDAGATAAIPVPRWLQVTDRDLGALRSRAATLDRAATTAAATARSRVRDSGIAAALAIAGLLLVLVAAGALLARAIRRPIREVAETARRAADRRAGPDPAGADPEPVPVASPDEVGATARAVHDLDQTVVDRLRGNGGHHEATLSAHLARRNRPLLDRQRALIAELAATDMPPERVRVLRDIDALATRMHRNTDSVLVVAGLEEPREAAPPRQLRELVRDAIADVAQFVGVEVVGLPDGVEIAHDAGDDVEHILAELLENAARAATEGTPVLVSARRAGDRLELCVSDEGRGMPVDRLDALNEVLAHPPLPGFDRSLSVGLVAVARLAERIRASVTLRSAADVGTVATLSLPARILRTASRVPGAVAPDTGPAAPSGSTPDEGTPIVATPEPTGPTGPTGPTDDAPPPPAPVPRAIQPILVVPTSPPAAISPVPVPVVLSRTHPQVPPIDGEEGEEEPPRLVRFSPVPVVGGHDLLPPPARHPRHRRHREGRGAPAPVPVPEPPPGPDAVAFARVDRRAE